MSDQRSFTDDLKSLVDTLETKTSFIFESVAETFLGKADDLRDGSEFSPVVLPRDLYAHDNVQTEWWYYTGHIRTQSGKNFGFEFVFFKRRTDLDKFSVVPLRLLGNPIYFAHFAITDKDSGNFRFSHRKSSNGPFDKSALMSSDAYFLKLGDWMVRESSGSHIISVELEDGTSFQANLTPQKPPILNGEKGDGVSFKDEGQASRYFSYTRMEVEGDLVSDGGHERFTGNAWMDREFGTWTPTERQKGWDWFSVQLNDDTEIMCYQLRDSEGAVSPYSSGSTVSADGARAHLTSSDFSITVHDTWTSPKTGAAYPSGWTIRIPNQEIELIIEPVIEDQELDTRGTTMIVYWEGACRVTGRKRGKDIQGDAYVELVGYDRSHENPNLAYFLIGSSF